MNDRAHSISLITATACLCMVAVASAQAPAAHRFVNVAPGVFAALGNGTIETGSTAAVIVNDDDVLLVDTQSTPEAMRRLVADIKTFTDKPIRYVVNTHGHPDHIGGNQVFGPDVTIIGHVNGRAAILGASFKNQLATPTPPTLVFEDRLTLFRGHREIQLIHPGRGHTDADILVYLPREKILITGDFFEGESTGSLASGFYDEWANNLEKLKAIDYETVIPGHGEPFKGKQYISHFQALLRDIWTRTTALYDQKVPMAEAARRLDLTSHKAYYPEVDDPDFRQAPVARIYQVLEQRARTN